MPDERKVAVYIDGFNLYHAIDALHDPSLKWINLAALSRSFLRRGEVLAKCHYFTTIVNWSQQKEANHRTYISALIAKDVIVTMGRFKKSKRHCAQFSRMCVFREEKRTDVALGIQIVSDALNSVFDRMVLVTADTDQIPTLEMVSALRPDLSMTWAAPPQRLDKAREIGAIMPDRFEISAGRLRTCRLPKIVIDDQGKIAATMPPNYA